MTMSIEKVEYNYSITDTSVAVERVINGESEMLTVNTVMSNNVVDFDATEAAIREAVYGSEAPEPVPPPEPNESDD